MTEYNALIIDDHPLISEAYKSALLFIEKTDKTISFHIDVAHDCDTANDFIKSYADKKDIKLDLVFLDISLPPSKDGKILSGEDLGLIINNKIPTTKVIVSTTFNDNFRIHSILKNLNPDGFLIKNDIVPKELITAIKEVLDEPPYYSKSVMKLIRKQFTSDLILDDVDRRILYEISIGTKMKDIKNVPLSVHGIEKRKKVLKKILDVQNSDDKSLILVAKEKGFI